MNAILYGWNIMRGVRLVMGVIAIVQAIATKEWILGLAAGSLWFMSLANIGCCGPNGCAIQPPSKSSRSKE
jgi:hypothetical protein